MGARPFNWPRVALRLLHLLPDRGDDGGRGLLGALARAVRAAEAGLHLAAVHLLNDGGDLRLGGVALPGVPEHRAALLAGGRADVGPQRVPVVRAGAEEGEDVLIGLLRPLFGGALVRRVLAEGVAEIRAERGDDDELVGHGHRAPLGLRRLLGEREGLVEHDQGLEAVGVRQGGAEGREDGGTGGRGAEELVDHLELTRRGLVPQELLQGVVLRPAPLGVGGVRVELLDELLQERLLRGGQRRRVGVGGVGVGGHEHEARGHDAQRHDGAGGGVETGLRLHLGLSCRQVSHVFPELGLSPGSLLKACICECDWGVGLVPLGHLFLCSITGSFRS